MEGKTWIWLGIVLFISLITILVLFIWMVLNKNINHVMMSKTKPAIKTKK